jgi:hypothetical protein
MDNGGHVGQAKKVGPGTTPALRHFKERQRAVGLFTYVLLNEETTLRKNYNCTPERFVEVWQAAECCDEVAKILGMPKSIVHARASGYRAMGVRLKKMPRIRRNRVDVEALNRTIDGPQGEADSRPAWG